jgi:PucR family transcriptional regulator, purine catabolism regulatory protein
VPSLRDLWRSVFPSARPFTGQGQALDRPVAWVRVLRARVPAFDALEAEDLAIVAQQTLDQLRALGVEPVSVVEAVAAAGGSGLLLAGDARAGGGEAHDMLARAAARGVAGFLLAEGDVSSLERSAIAYIVTGQAELERRVAELESDVERAALAGGGVSGMAATIGRFLARPVAVEGPGGEVLAVHAPPDAATDAPLVTDYLQRRKGGALRTALPLGAAERTVRRQGTPALVLLGSAPPSELDELAARRVAGLLALELDRGGRTGPHDPARTEQLPSAGPPWLVIVARQLDDAQPTTHEQRERLRHELLRAEPANRLTLRGDAASLELRAMAAPPGDDPEGLALAARLAHRLARPVVVSPLFDDAARRPVLEAEARLALEAIEALPPDERQRLALAEGVIVGRAQLAPAYRLLAAVAGLPDGLRHARALLAPLLSGRAERDERVLATLRSVLDHAGLSEAAAALGIHRNTLTYRVARIEQLTGWQLSDATLRFSLGLAVRLVQSAQGSPRTGTDSTPLLTSAGR